MDMARFHPGLTLLLQAHEYAAALGRDPWDFAVELPAVLAAGLTRSDLRWMVCTGMVGHAAEVPADRPDGARAFGAVGGLALTDRCCFVLTGPGVEAARRAVGLAPPAPPGPAAAGPGPAPPPCWEPDRRTLRYRDRVVKHYKLPAPNQELVLVSFQEEGWPVRIDDPLPTLRGVEPKRRLHDTVVALNRNQRAALLRFYGDGSGQAVCWEPRAGE